MSLNREESIREIRTQVRSDAAVPVAVRRTLRRCLESLEALVRRHRQRARLRRELERLDCRQLRDIGVSREYLQAEAYKPFWRR